MDVPSFLKQLYGLVFTSEQVRSGFFRAGVLPFGSNSVQENVVQQRSQPPGKSNQSSIQAR